MSLQYKLAEIKPPGLNWDGTASSFNCDKCSLGKTISPSPKENRHMDILMFLKKICIQCVKH
jgi:hypothetical protein